MKARLPLLLLGALLAIGCSDVTGPARLNGSWTHDYGFPGSSLSFTLATVGDAVSGAGTWTGEACCSGTVAITGTDTDGDVELDFVFTATGGMVPAFSYHFSGRLLGPNDLVGDIRSSDTILEYAYKRVR
jgi:hypothetical protein